MWCKLEEVFEKLGVPYYRQGSFSSEDDYEDTSFFTFWNPNTEEGAFYDDKSHKAIWHWNIFYYTCDPSTIYSKLEEFSKLAKETGFILDGRGHDIQSDRPDYPGRTITVIYIEDYEKKQEV